MSILETVLVFVGIPAAANGVLALLCFAPSASRAPRYRPGRPWPYPPVWYLPRPERVPGEPTDRPALTAASAASTARSSAHGSW